MVKSIKSDCDGDTLLLEVDPKGPACHTGDQTCFNRVLSDIDQCEFDELVEDKDIFKDLFSVIDDRKKNPKDGSYTNKLLNDGIARIAQKVVEEAGETAIAGVLGHTQELSEEISDLIYHIFVLMSANEVTLAAVVNELSQRRDSVK